ncbi:MAG: GNAT family N-acetyltransferase, partial [Noviherbaspirillum sp.]
GFRWGLERLQDRRLIGTCGLFRWNKSWRNCVIGYEIERGCQGHGYMQEALVAVLDYGFDMMHLHRVQAETHPDNQASIRLATRLGFRLEGVHREQAYWGGSFHDLNCYSLLEREWRARKHCNLSQGGSGKGRRL